jgi:hypothetical protein
LDTKEDMTRTNRLSLLAVAVTALVLLLGYGAYWGVKQLLTPAAAPIQQAEEVNQIAAETADQDKDGLSDLVENIYKTKADVADSDGDGSNDGQEVAQGRNPAVAGPNDKLLDVPLASEVINTDTYTGKYLASLPADLAKEQILDKARLEAFVEENKGELLPPLPAGTVKTSTASGKEAVQVYLDKISSTTNKELKLVTSTEIEAAFRASYADPKNSQLRNVRTALEKNFTILKGVEAPAEAKDLHEKLLMATQSLVTNVELLEHMSKDFVSGMIGAKNIELLGSVFQDIAGQISALEEKYGLQ